MQKRLTIFGAVKNTRDSQCGVGSGCASADIVGPPQTAPTIHARTGRFKRNFKLLIREMEFIFNHGKDEDAPKTRYKYLYFRTGLAERFLSEFSNVNTESRRYWSKECIYNTV